MSFSLPELPFAKEALEPHMSRETLEYHYGKHHKAYVDKANKLIAGTEFEKASLEDTIQKANGGLLNQVQQIWNHTFFWNCLTPNPKEPGKKLADALVKTFGGVEDFKKEFAAAAAGNFGSGWTWLVQNADGTLAVENTSNADTPLRHGKKAILTVDVWEHAYYIDYRNSRANYLEHYWQIVNWAFAESNLG
ncbi:MAG: superoxide dismutase [Nevskiaceae bacterium]|nr:MAG: superoxide dismutase [Nevskiaceae bacterium]TBR71754.1 MAG: superoxide dismutase [Nevskiaceae bacterium]